LTPRQALEPFQRAWTQRPDPPAIAAAFVAGLARPEFLGEMDAIAVVAELKLQISYLKTDPTFGRPHGESAEIKRGLQIGLLPVRRSSRQSSIFRDLQ